ncbi:cytochrome-c peroxidase [Polaribacter sp. ALD11]|uniref:cytochrome-c peroxidase n=1 Tax=Polaribacter sp. ALD11 TaxID=2058137 RepID=UPI000C309792|nr:cytochrome-c peroxidase [Polaribacter sp. ALD11]AUC85688.1 cytochrome-c peroxidase [Polaribacter sp. ALD11]
MKKLLMSILSLFLISSCTKEDVYEPFIFDNPEIEVNIPVEFPELNNSFYINKPTKYGVELGKKLFFDKKLSANNTISCASCHLQENAFTDNTTQAIGIYGRVGFRNTPPIQNLAFMKFYNWDGNKQVLESQPLVPIITHEEMDSSILEVIGKLEIEEDYINLFYNAFGDDKITGERIYNSIAQYEYTLISANSKYDKVQRNEGEYFTDDEARGYTIFKEKCTSCHSSELFTDQSFRNIGFPINPDTEEGGRSRVTGKIDDYMRFRVPSLRNIEYTAPYGSFGQFTSLKEVLDYLDNGVLEANNLDPFFKDNENRIALTEEEKSNLISFMKTLSDIEFVGQ